MKRLIIPLITAAVLGLAVVGVGVGLAQEDNGTVNTFLSKVAAKLGISEEKLATAVDEAYDETLDEEVTAGRLTEEQADRMKERGFDFAPQFGRGPGFGFGGRGLLGGVQLVDAAAEALGMSAEDLTAEMRDGKSLADVAEAKGISVEDLTADLLGQVKAKLDELVGEGVLSQEQADNLYAQTEEDIDKIVSGDCGSLGVRGFGPGFGFGERGPMQGVRVMDAAAEVLGMSTEDLMAEMRDGKSLADIAEAKGISVEELTSDLLGQVKAQLDSLVSEGKLTQERADSIYAQTESSIDQIVSGQSGFFGGGFPPGPRGMESVPGPGSMPDPSANPTPGGVVESGTGL